MTISPWISKYKQDIFIDKVRVRNPMFWISRKRFMWSSYNLPMLMRIIFHHSTSFQDTIHRNTLTVPSIFPWQIFWAPFRSSIHPDVSSFEICPNCTPPLKLFHRYILRSSQGWFSVFLAFLFLKADSTHRVRLRRTSGNN